MENVVVHALQDYSEDKTEFVRQSRQTYNRTDTQQINLNLTKLVQAIRIQFVIADKMTDSIHKAIKMFSSSSSNQLSYNYMHKAMAAIVETVDELWIQFHRLEMLAIDKYKFHLLPFAIYLDVLYNDRQSLLKLVKIYEERAATSLWKTRKMQDPREIKRLSGEIMAVINISCSKHDLGLITMVSKNIKFAFGVDWQTTLGRNINDLLAFNFQSVHRQMMLNLMNDHDKPYLGRFLKRYVRFDENFEVT